MRAGYSLVETLAALAAGSIVTTLVASTIVVQTRVAATIARSAESAEGMALAGAVLAAETRDISPDDIAAAGADSLALRAFRATATVCDTVDARAIVRWAGSRGPDASKDSAILLRAGSAITLPVAAPLAVAGAPACALRPHERLYRIDTGWPLMRGDVLLVFERGAYHLSGRALRWRAGDAGRQPLTAEIFADDVAAFDAGPPLSVRLRTRALHVRDAALALRVPLRHLGTDGPP